MSAAAPCPSGARTRDRLARREEDLLSRDETRLLREHLAACPSCRADALRLDPTLLFVPLAAVEDDARRASRRSLESDAAAVTSDVLAAVEIARARRRIEPVAWWRRPAARTALRAASLALVSGGLVALLASRGSRVAEGPGPAVAVRGSQALEPASSVAPVAMKASTPLIEGLKSPGATIYQFAGSAGQPNVVFVVDRNADL